MTHAQTVIGTPPSKSNGYKIITINGHGSLAKTEKLKAYEKSFYLQCSHYRNKNISGLFELHTDIYYPSNRSDLDGSFKILLDCLQQVKAITNDNNCVKIAANKYIDKNNPRIEFTLIVI